MRVDQPRKHGLAFAADDVFHVRIARSELLAVADVENPAFVYRNRGVIEYLARGVHGHYDGVGNQAVNHMVSSPSLSRGCVIAAVAG